MRYLGLDLGSKTLGLSMSDITGTIATTYKTIKFESEDYSSILPELKNIVENEQINKIVLGLPKNMNNTIGPRGEVSLMFKKMLEEYLNIEVIMQDERRTTIEAENYMLAADISRKKRKQKIDSLAANIILQSYLDKKKGMDL